MIDLHNHLLPGIDDGAKKLEETLEFLRLAARDGVKVVVATPHMKPGVYDNRREIILQRVALVREAQRGDEAEGVTLLPGAEVYYTADLTARARANELMTVGDRGRYLLLELPYQQTPMRVDDTIFQLRLLGITPLMAHPERVAYYLEDIERVAASVRLGALLQRNLVHVLASDGHDVRYRPPILSEAVRAAASLVGETAARRLVEDTPQAILDGREVEVEEARPPFRRRGLFSLLRSFLHR